MNGEDKGAGLRRSLPSHTATGRVGGKEKEKEEGRIKEKEEKDKGEKGKNKGERGEG